MWVLGSVACVLGIVAWVLGIVAWVLGVVAWVLGSVISSFTGLRQAVNNPAVRTRTSAKMLIFFMIFLLFIWIHFYYFRINDNYAGKLRLNFLVS